MSRDSLTADEDDGAAGDDEESDGEDEMEDPSSDDEDAGDVDELLDEALDNETEESNIRTNTKPPATKDSAAAAAAQPVSYCFHLVTKLTILLHFVGSLFLPSCMSM